MASKRRRMNGTTERKIESYMQAASANVQVEPPACEDVIMNDSPDNIVNRVWMRFDEYVRRIDLLSRCVDEAGVQEDDEVQSEAEENVNDDDEDDDDTLMTMQSQIEKTCAFSMVVGMSAADYVAAVDRVVLLPVARVRTAVVKQALHTTPKLSSYAQVWDALENRTSIVRSIDMPLPLVFGPLTDSTIIAWVSSLNENPPSKRFAIETKIFEHDQEQLTYQRVYTPPDGGASVMLPKCIFGAPIKDASFHDCCWSFRVGYVQGAGVVYINEPLQMYLTKDQQKRFNQCGEIPDSTPICLLCQRFMTALAAYECEYLEVPITGSFQEYGVLVDVPGGYKASECIMPNGKNGLIAPIVRPDEDKLQIVNYVDPRTPHIQRWVVNQRQLCAVF